MTVEFDLSTAKIDIDAAGARTQMKILTDARSGTKFAFFHLSRGTAASIDTLGFAFGLTGHVKLKAGFDVGRLKDWRFGFTQVAAQQNLRLIYLGRTQLEGHIEIDVGKALGTSFLLDKMKTAPMPFYQDPSSNELDGEVFATMGDHPALQIHQTLRNEKTGYVNTLYRIDDRRRFVSTFVGKAPSGRIIAFAHVEWKLSYDADFQIIDGKPQATGRRGGLHFGSVSLGAHSGIPANPQPPTANEAAALALKVFVPPNKFRFDGLFYPPGTPDNFIFDIRSAASLVKAKGAP